MELEKQFFDAFGIEERCETDKHCCNWLCDSYHYPQITDRILLELILIALNYYYEIDFSELDMSDLNGLKDSILELLIELVSSDDFREGGLKDVQALFEEER